MFCNHDLILLPTLGTVESKRLWLPAARSGAASFTVRKLECSKQVCASLNTLAWNNKIELQNNYLNILIVNMLLFGYSLGGSNLILG